MVAPTLTSDDLPMSDLNIRSKRTEALQMLVDGPAPYVASARKRNLRMLILPKQRSQKIIRRSDLLDIIVLYVNTVDILPVDPDSVAVHSVNCRSYPRNRIQ